MKKIKETKLWQLCELVCDLKREKDILEIYEKFVDLKFEPDKKEDLNLAYKILKAFLLRYYQEKFNDYDVECFCDSIDEYGFLERSLKVLEDLKDEEKENLSAVELSLIVSCSVEKKDLPDLTNPIFKDMSDEDITFSLYSLNALFGHPEIQFDIERYEEDFIGIFEDQEDFIKKHYKLEEKIEEELWDCLDLYEIADSLMARDDKCRFGDSPKEMLYIYYDAVPKICVFKNRYFSKEYRRRFLRK